MSRRTLICGSLAYDTIMVFPDRFARHILPDQTHVLSVSFQIGEMRREAEPGLDSALQGIGQQERAGIVRAAVDAVGIGSYRSNSGVSIEPHGEAQQEFGPAKRRRLPGAVHALGWL